MRMELMFKELKGVLGAATVFGLAASGTACTTVSPHTVEANNPQEFFYAGQTANSYILLYLEKNPPGSPGYEAINLPKNTSLYYTVDGEIYVGDKNGVPAIGGFAKNYDGYRSQWIRENDCRIWPYAIRYKTPSLQ